MISIYAVSFLSTRVASKSAYTIREKIFHILMNLPDVEISKFKISGLVTRSTRGMASEQGFIVMILGQLLLIPITLVAIIYEIALIDGTYAIFFLAFVSVIAIIIIFRMKQIVKIFFRAKKTYGKLNLMFLSKISNIATESHLKNRRMMLNLKRHVKIPMIKTSSILKVNITLDQYYYGLYIQLS